MSNESLCLRRPTILSPLPERRTRPPDGYSIEFSRLMMELNISKKRLIEKEIHSDDLQQEVKRLKLSLLAITKERDDARIAYAEERRQNMDSKSRLESVSEKLNEQSNTFNRLVNIVRVTTIYNGVVSSTLVEKEEEAERTERDIELEKKAIFNNTQNTISRLCRRVSSLEHENNLISQNAKELEEKVYRNDSDNDRYSREIRVLQDEKKELKSDIQTLKATNKTLCSEIRQAEKNIADQKLELDSRIDNLLEENKTLVAANQKLMEQSSTKTSTNSENDEGFLREEKLRTIMQLRSSIFNEIQSIRGNIRVYCRVRPPKFPDTEPSVLRLPSADTGNTWNVACDKHSFSFNHVFHPFATNSDVYAETAGVVEMVLEGKNVCILAYGQTGSGKTHTMDGTDSDPGVNALAVRQLFGLASDDSQSPRLSVSVMEIYNDTIQDLLASTSGGNIRKPSSRQATARYRSLQIRNVSGSPEEVHVPGLTFLHTKSLDDFWRLMKSARKNRAVSSTHMNTSSSRSHFVIEVRVEKGNSTSRLHLVDLAGSERVSRSKVNGQRLQEAIHINKSLSSLANVFSALEKRRPHIPYRDCKLTHFLRNSIGGEAKTLMFLMVSGDQEDKKETFATLEFGQRVSGIVTSHDLSKENRRRLKELEGKLQSVEREIQFLDGENNRAKNSPSDSS